MDKCSKYHYEPQFQLLTKTYKNLLHPTCTDLYKKLDKGLNDIKYGRVRPFDDVMDEIMDSLQKRIDGV